MIKKLRIKITFIITVLVSAIIVALMVSINVISQNNSQASINNRLRQLASDDGNMTVYGGIDPYRDDNLEYIDNFSVLLNKYDKVIGIVVNRDVDVEQTDIIPYVSQVLFSGQVGGEIGKYAYYSEEKSYGRIVVFLNISSQKQSNQSLFVTTSVIGGIAIVIFFLIATILSGWLVKPVKETFNKQKMFISNASHELKTPIAVISANAEVLESEIGENKWLSYIGSESRRMGELVNELLCLARLDDKSGKEIVMSKINLTELFLGTVLPFESTVFEMGRKLDVQAEENIEYYGDESSIKHVLTILIDNAIKYSFENGEISVKLYEHSGKKIIEVYNTGEGIPRDKLKKIFERFYREDEVRNSKSGGYGLGLAIAKSIVEVHNGKIYAESEYGKWAKFVVVL